ncbi:MAG: hypothetical protein E5Y69_14415 [Mesorhizobium sp.]|nr:MAG: hypothetical protein E5Y69_14415 [Mesorhizobium sp.]
MALDIKICGLKTDKALAAALAGGASHVGFILFAKSPRYVEPAEAGRLREGVDYMLSGGINAANIGDALRLANPSGLDISSGVESAPGVKDPALIEQFFRAVRAARDNRAA